MAKCFINKVLSVGFEKKVKIFTQGIAQIKNSCIFALALQQMLWSVRLSVRTPGFHPGKRGSIPLRTTMFLLKHKIS